MLSRSALRLLNHLLFHEAWARSRLKPFAGQTLFLEVGGLAVLLSIDNSGLFEANSNREVTPTVSINLPSDWLRHAVANRSSIFSLANITGSVDLAETLGFVFRNLQWDAESDLALWIGDVAALRFVRGSKRFLFWHVEALKRLSLNFTEFFVEENPTITRGLDLAKFCTEVDGVSEECTRLEKRLERLEYY
jgi:ubiquinone biosynthesis accessory factor UbiJ